MQCSYNAACIYYPLYCCRSVVEWQRESLMSVCCYAAILIKCSSRKTRRRSVQ